MQFAIDIPLFGPFADVHTVIDLARKAEAAGWHGFFVWDHVSFYSGPTADPWITLAALALNTTRIRLGAMVTPLPRRRPWKVARETATLDWLCGGRLVFGAGLGGGGEEWRDFGEDPDEKKRGAQLDEALDVLAGLWSGQVFSYSGVHYRVNEKRFLPTPLQQPRIPVWIAGMWPNKSPFRRAARWDGVFPIGRGLSLSQMMTPQDMADAAAYVRSLRTSDGPYDVVHSGFSPAHPVQAGAVAAPYVDAGVTWWVENVNPWVFGIEWPQLPGESWPVEQMRERIQAGPPHV